MATSQVFVAELARFRCLRPLGGPVPQEELPLVEAIETVLAVMSVFAPTCLLMRKRRSSAHIWGLTLRRVATYHDAADVSLLVKNFRCGKKYYAQLYFLDLCLE